MWLATALRHWDPSSSVLVLEGRAFVSREFAGVRLDKNHKAQHHLRFLASMYRRPPNSAHNFHAGSTGRLGLNYSAHPDHSLPPLVMAKRLGYDMPGLLIPNPYFAEEGLGIWARTLKHIKEKVAERPFGSRIPRAFWRAAVWKSKFYG